MNCVTRAAAFLRANFTPHPPRSSRTIFFGFGRVTLFLTIDFGTASRSIFPDLGPRHARNFLGFTLTPITPSLVTRGVIYKWAQILAQCLKFGIKFELRGFVKLASSLLYSRCFVKLASPLLYSPRTTEEHGGEYARKCSKAAHEVYPPAPAPSRHICELWVCPTPIRTAHVWY